MIDILEYLENKDIEFKGPNKRDFITLEECPYCGGKNKLYVYVDKEGTDYNYGKFKCFKCEVEPNSNFNFLRAKIEGKDPSNFKYENKDDDNEYLSLNFTNELDTKKESFLKTLEKYPIMDMPQYTRLIESGDKQAITYLKKRGLSFEQAIKMGVYVSVFNNYKHLKEVYKKSTNKEKEILDEVKRYTGRVIIPLKVIDKIYGYVARDYTGKIDPKYKVLNSRGALTTAFIWNFDNVKKSKRVVICEGIFDAIKNGLDQSVAMLGKDVNPNSDKIKLLTTLRPEEFIIYPDNGALSDALSLAEVLSMKTSARVRICVFNPTINTQISNIDIESFKLISKVIKLDVNEDGELIIEPEELKFIQDIVKIFDKIEDNLTLPSLLKRYEAYERYKKNKGLFKKFTSYVFALDNSDQKEEILKKLSITKKWDFVDAGDRSKKENQELIENSHDFIPGLDLSLIM